MTTEQAPTVFPVSGTSYYSVCDPKASGVPDEESWPRPRRQKVGRGERFWYPIEWADKVAEHLEIVGASFTGGGVDPETAAEGRVLLRDAARIRAMQASS